MARRSYGQYCGIARALEIVGERWAFLIVRELLLGPKRYSDFQQGLPKVPTNILADRLKELEASGIIERLNVSHGRVRVAYQLTPRGRELEDVLLRVWRWGVHDLPESGPGGRTPVDPAIRAMRAAFRPERAAGRTAMFQLRFGAFVMFLRIENCEIEVGDGPAKEPDLSIDVRASLTPILIGDVSPDEAVKAGLIELEGQTELFTEFVDWFRIPPDAMLERIGLEPAVQDR